MLQPGRGRASPCTLVIQGTSPLTCRRQQGLRSKGRHLFSARTALQQASTGAISPTLMPSELAHPHPHQEGSSTVLTRQGAGPALLSAAAREKCQASALVLMPSGPADLLPCQQSSLSGCPGEVQVLLSPVLQLGGLGPVLLLLRPVRGGTHSVQPYPLCFGGNRNPRHDRGCCWAISTDVALAGSSGLDITMALGGKQVTDLCTLLAAFTSLNLPVSIQHEPFSLYRSYPTIYLLSIIEPIHSDQLQIPS